MDFESLLNAETLRGIGLRWLHIMAAIALFGGTLFQALALRPACGELPEAERAKFCEAVRRRWSKVVMLSILVLLVSGIVNFMFTIWSFNGFVTAQADGHISLRDKEELMLPKFYHMIFGIKVLLALGIFFIASVMAGRSKATQGIRDNPGKWIGATIIMAMVLIALSATLRSTHTGPNVFKVLGTQVDLNPPPDFNPDVKGDEKDMTNQEAETPKDIQDMKFEQIPE